MRQQVNFTVEMTFDADASLDAVALQHAVNELLYPLWVQGQTARTSALVLVRTSVSKPIEEAAIYGNDEPEPCPVNRRPVDSCPDGCTHGADDVLALARRVQLAEAAPALLEALEGMVELFDHCGLNGLILSSGRKHGWTVQDVNNRIHACNVAKAAIAAARA